MISFHKRTRFADEKKVLDSVLTMDNLSGDGQYTQKCHSWLKDWTGCQEALLTPSGTAALELCCLLLDLECGDEVILPSYTFSSCANAIALRGGVPVFVDVEPKTLNIDASLIEPAITKKTRAIMVVHYAGVICEMDQILDVAKRHNLAVIEDAAQAIGSTYKGQPAGSFGDAAAFSFHSTKNIACGEGGAFVTRREDWANRAEIIREKGTNRSQFLEGLVDKYSWVDIGSSYLPSEIQAALLWVQLQHFQEITDQRNAIWRLYRKLLSDIDNKHLFELLEPPDHCDHNAHIFGLMFSARVDRAKVISTMQEQGVSTAFHYVPLHQAKAGKDYCKTLMKLPVSEEAGSSLLRLPLYPGLAIDEIQKVVEAFAIVLSDSERTGEQ